MSRSNDIAGLTTSILDGVTAAEVGLGNVTNESKATMFTSPTFTGTTNVSSGVTLPSNPTIVLGSNTTFPNGHILQVVLGNSATESSGTGDQLAVSQSITLSDSSNKLLAFGSLAWEITGGDRSQRFGGIKIATSGSGTNQTYLASVTDTTGPLGFRLTTPTSNTLWKLAGHSPINYIFEPVYAGAVTVSLYGVGYDSNYGVMTTNRNDTTHGHSTLVLMEVVA